MVRSVYVNGGWFPETEARISVFDRGFLMADAVYEVTCVLDGRLLDFDGHNRRLDRSLRELGFKNPFSRDEWLDLHREAVRRNALTDGFLYLQVTRGNPGDRDFALPGSDLPPGLVLFTQARPHPAEADLPGPGISVISLPDLRWQRRDIKTVQLLWPSLAKTEALRQGADDAWLVEDGHVTEGTSNNVWILRDGRLITRQTDHAILHGITRAVVLRLVQQTGIALEERPFTLAEAAAADEAFVTSAGAFVTPVVTLDGKPIASGLPGAVTTRLAKAFLRDSVARAI